MLLEDATSKEQVAAALAAGDTELAEDINELLDDARRRWEAKPDYCEEETIEVESWFEASDFIDEIIKQSKVPWDLSQIPREYVAKKLKELAERVQAAPRRNRDDLRPFELSEHSKDGFSYGITPQLDCYFPDRFFPENAEFIPEDVARKFWNGFRHTEWHQTSTIADNNGWSEGYNTYYITTRETDFNEWCRDTLAEFIDQELRDDPDAGLRRFYTALGPEATQVLAQAGLSREELLDFASTYLGGFGDDADDVTAQIGEYVEALRRPEDDTREVVDTWEHPELVLYGIVRGTLFEEAPWRLVKLVPADLLVEGAQMRNCVGDKSMGYIQAVHRKEIEIWSLRSRAGKPRFTLEIDPQALERGDSRGVEQIKGKANRLPGFSDASRQQLKFPEEVIFWYRFFSEMGLNPYDIVDLFPGLVAMSGHSALQLRANPVRSFNLPYQRNPVGWTPYRYW